MAFYQLFNWGHITTFVTELKQPLTLALHLAPKLLSGLGKSQPDG